MFGSDKKPSGVSNWFFSLRRQPKKQKSLDSSKLLQKSCVDLTAVGGTSGSEQDLLFSSTKPSKLKLNGSSKSSNNNNDDASSNSNSCTNCCCKFSSKTSSPSPIDDDIEQCDQLRRVLITNEENYSAVECNDDDRMPPNNFSNNILLYNKKEEFTRTTRTVTTRILTKATVNGNETIASSRTNSNNHQHRIGLVFNENGQLMNRRHLVTSKNRDGLIFDECGRLLYTDDETSSSHTPISILDDTIEFIDSSTQNSDIQNRANMQHKCSNSNNSDSKLTLSSSLMSNCKSELDYNKQVIFLTLACVGG